MISNDLFIKKISSFKRKEKKACFSIVMIVVFTLISNAQYSFADTTVEWIKDGNVLSNFEEVPMESGDLDGIEAPTFLRITSTGLGGFDGNGNTDQISVTVSSSLGDVINLSLNEDGDTGVFENDKVIFILNNARFQLGDSGAIFIKADDRSEDGISEDILFGGSDGGFIISESNFDGIEIDLFEIEDTGVFTRPLILCNLPGCSDSSTATIEVTADDTITVFDDFNGLVTNGYVVSNTSGNGAIISGDGEIVTATFDGTEASITSTYFGPGSGGGGVVTPGLVVDSGPGGPGGPEDEGIGAGDETNGSGCSGDCTPPTLGVDKDNKRLVDKGFSYNGNPKDAELYFTPYPLIEVEVGKENLAILKIYDNLGTQNIEHVGLAFGLGEGESFNDSKATIILDRTENGGETTSVYDPENVLENVRIVTETGSCSNSVLTQCLIVYIYHTFREPLNFNMVGTLVWDFYRNSWQNYYNHGIHITGKSLNPPKTELVYFGTHGMHDTYKLTRIDKLKDHWQDEFGNIYQHKGNDRYDRIYSEPKPFVRDALTSHGCDRNCNWFNEYKLEQEVLAKKTLTEMLAGKIIQGEPLEEAFTIYFHITKRSEDPVLQQNIKDEIVKATELYMETYPKKPVHNFLN